MIHPAGDDALLIDLGDVTARELHAAAARVRVVARRVIPGHSSLYVIGAARSEVERALAAPAVHEASGVSRQRIDVSFTGEDFPEFLARCRLTPDAFLSRVATLRLTARYLGFRGGFAYLDGWPAEWAMPRRPTNRPLVLRGTFAIAGSVAAFYPIDSPGGWNLLGRTAADLRDAFAPGDEITIVPSLEPIDVPPLRVERTPLVVPRADVLSPGQLTLMTDKPFDDVAARAANLAVGNDAEAAILECTLVAPRLRFRERTLVCWFGGESDMRRFVVEPGEEFAPARIQGGLRGYLAVCDRHSCLSAAQTGMSAPHRQSRLTIHAMRGPHDIGLDDLECEVTPQLDRIGIRLKPRKPIDAQIPADLKSVGMQRGTIQLHPDGTLVAMGPDHPITGGYLQPLTVISSERWKLAQLQPGELVRFVVQPPYA